MSDHTKGGVIHRNHSSFSVEKVLFIEKCIEYKN